MPKTKKTNVKKRVTPLAPPPMRSRKKARHVTTTFHKLTRQRDVAERNGQVEEVQRIEDQLNAMGGRREYQRASQVSVSYFSTSKWVLGYLTSNGWLFGIPTVPEETETASLRTDNEGNDSSSSSRSSVVTRDDTARQKRKKTQRRERRCTTLLEVGAINTELLDASKKTEGGIGSRTEVSLKYKLRVRSIDLHSIADGIEEADFLKMPVQHRDVNKRYDVIVCSMVLNCVTSPEVRGEMIGRLYHHLRPGGLCFLTIPKSCLTLSPYVNNEVFVRILKAVGFVLQETKKESPKVSFFVVKRPELGRQQQQQQQVDDADIAHFSRVVKIRQGKKFRNDFSVCLSRDSVLGTNLTYLD